MEEGNFGGRKGGNQQQDHHLEGKTSIVRLANKKVVSEKLSFWEQSSANAQRDRDRPKYSFLKRSRGSEASGLTLATSSDPNVGKSDDMTSSLPPMAISSQSESSAKDQRGQTLDEERLTSSLFVTPTGTGATDSPTMRNRQLQKLEKELNLHQKKN